MIWAMIKNSLNYQIIIMQRLFAISNTRTLQRLGLSAQTFPNFQKALLKNNIKATGQDLLFRIPREDFRILINTHCPINSLESPNAQEIIKATKLLRHQAKHKEVKVCGNCRFLKNCRWAKKPLENVQYDNTLRDLLIFLYGLQTLYMGQKYYPMYLRVYKMNDYLMPIIDDLSKGGSEFQLFCKTREAIINSYEQPKKEVQTSGAQSRKEEEDLARRAEEFQRASGLGRDFSYDQQAEFDQAHSKKEKVEQAQIKVNKNESTTKDLQLDKQAIKIEKMAEEKEQENNQVKKPSQTRRRRSVKHYIETDNLKLNVIRNIETTDESNHPRFEQLRRKIKFQHKQQQKMKGKRSNNKTQQTKPDENPKQSLEKRTKHRTQQNAPPDK